VCCIDAFIDIALADSADNDEHVDFRAGERASRHPSSAQPPLLSCQTEGPLCGLEFCIHSPYQWHGRLPIRQRHRRHEPCACLTSTYLNEATLQDRSRIGHFHKMHQQT
jgi:hypothetical protein